MITRPQAIRAFHRQKNAAIFRGVEWQLSFDQWLEMWTASGHWHERGRHVGQYVMARKGDVGPYAFGNVYICTCSQNVRDFRTAHGAAHYIAMRRSHLERALTTRGWTYLPHRNKKNPYQVTAFKKYIGSFPTQHEAEVAHRDFVLSALRMTKREGTGRETKGNGGDS